MDLARWRRHDDSLLNLRDQIDRLFDQFWPGPSGLAGWLPAVDVAETPDEFVVNVDVPGIELDDIKVSAEDDVLTISGEKREKVEDNHRNYYRIERRYGSFTRSIPLPTSVDTDKVNTSAKNGVLTVTLPKKAEEKAKRVEVKVE